MSLLWYYRPEHTEQGRQPNDCADEVFASKHQDHNSVACIEDKCYVLTFNEYCRQVSPSAAHTFRSLFRVRYTIILISILFCPIEIQVSQDDSCNRRGHR